MTNETILVPQRRIVEARPFYADRTDKALKELEDTRNPSYEAAYMPEIIDARIDIFNADSENARNHFMFQNWFKTLSLRATGKTRQGNAVIVYAHVPNDFSKSANITKAIEQGLTNGAGKMPQSEFQRLLDLQDDKLVYVIDHKALMESPSGAISVKDARKHLQTKPFLGQRADEYLDVHEKVYGSQIGNWRSDDLHDVPFGRLLVVGDHGNYGLDGDSDLGYGAHFLGVRKGTGEACAQKFFPPQDKLVEIINECVATPLQQQVKERVSALYR